jgi:hypothetical protein
VRVNLDEKAFNDPRFAELAAAMGWADVDLAVGAVSRIWMAALNRVSVENPSGLLTRKHAEFATRHKGLVDAMVACGLALDMPEGLYFAGVDARADFLLKQRARGTDGGKRRLANQAQANAQASAQANAQAPGSSVGSSLLSVSGSCSGSSSVYVSREGTQALLIPTEPKARFDFEALYKRYPGRKGKSGGMAICHRDIRIQADYEQLGRAIDAYAAERSGEDPKFTLHFATFMGKWEDYLPPGPSEQLDAEGAMLMQNNAWAARRDLAALEARRRAAGLSIPWENHPAHKAALEASA